MLSAPLKELQKLLRQFFTNKYGISMYTFYRLSFIMKYILATDEICREYRANRSRKAVYFLSEKLPYKVFQIMVVRITLY